MQAFGPTWGTRREESGADLIRFACQPSTIYTPLILSLTGGLENSGVEDIKALIHVTGGGLEGRVRFFCQKTCVGIRIDSPLATPEEVQEIVSLGNVDISEAYRTWNMGTGLIVVAAANRWETILDKARESGLNAQIIGRVTDEPIVSIVRYDRSSLVEQLT